MFLKTFAATLPPCGSAALLAIAVAGCDLSSLLDVTDPSRLLADNVETPEQVPALINGVEADFICGLGSYLLVTAVLSDEFENNNASGDSWSLDRRRPLGTEIWNGSECTGVVGAYVPVSRARWVADNAARLLESWTDAEVASRQARLARAQLLSGFSLYMLGAAHCSAALDVGPELTSMQLFKEAESRFSKTLEIAQAQASLSAIAKAARVGRARVRLYQGNEEGALADAQAVPEGFVMNVFPSNATERMYNRIWQRNLFTFSFSVPPWSRKLMTGGVADPRTATHDTGVNTGWSPGSVWAQEKYTSANSPIPIARWQEAQLIIAEIQGGQRAVDIINRLRDPWALSRFESTNESEIQDMIVQERRRELWLEGFRAYDIRRLTLPLVPAPGELFQEGITGGTYGEQTCIPLPTIESLNNETIRGG